MTPFPFKLQALFTTIDLQLIYAESSTGNTTHRQRKSKNWKYVLLLKEHKYNLIVEHIKCTFQLGLYSDMAWFRRTTKTLRIACLLAMRDKCVGGIKIILSNLLCVKVTKVAKFALALNQSMTTDTSIISSKGKAVLQIDKGKLWMGRPTRILRSATTMPGVGVEYGRGGS